MSGFSSKALLALLLSAGVAWAEPGGAPHSTAPMLEGSDTPQDDETPDANAPTAVEPADTDVATPPKGTISETSVSAPPIDGFGTLEQGKGALPPDIWSGSTRSAVDPLLLAIRSGIANETLRALVVQLLMTQAAPPQGSGAQGWFALRVNTLIAIGADDKAEAMIASLPASMTDPSLAELQTGLRLIRGEYDEACKKAQPDALPQDTGGEGFWRKLSILCQAHAGKQEEAMVGIDLMREERHTDDAFFQEAIRRVGDRNAPIKSSPKRWSLLDVALLRLSGDNEKLKSSLDAFPAVAVKYLAQDASLDANLREKAYLRAQALGVLPVGEGNKNPEQPFSRPLASDVTTLVRALGSGKPANDADNAVIARLALDEGGIQDSRRILRLLTLMEPFGYHVPSEIWEKLWMHRERYDGDMPPAGLVARLVEAGQQRKRGEALMLAALITGATDVDRTSDLALLPVVKALMAAGFEEDARHIAHEAVKAYSAR